MNFFRKIISFLLLIALLALLNTPAHATDVDGDLVPDRIDVDDDNDGILDSVEGLSAIVQWVTDGATQAGVTVENAVLNVGSNTSNIAVFPTAGASFRSNSSSSNVVFVAEGQSANGTFNITFDEPVYDFSLFIGSLFRTASAEARFGNVTLTLADGTVIPNADFTIINAGNNFFSFGAAVDLESITIGGNAFVRSSTISNSRSQSQGRGMLEFSALKSGIGLRTISIDQAGTANNNFTATMGLSGAFANDFDGDHIADHGDLDSDNDGIPDNVEAQSTNNYLSPNAAYNAAGIDTAYGPGLTPLDSDGDGDNDVYDLDSDDDGIDDSLETGFTLTGNYGVNGLDSGAESTDDFTDINGLSFDEPNFRLSDLDNDTLSDGSNAVSTNQDLSYRDASEDIDLVTVKTLNAPPGTFFSGATIAFNISVTNNSPGTQASNVSITDILPAGLTYSSHTTTSGTYNSVTGIWSIGDVKHGSVETIELSASIDQGQNGNTITNITTAAIGDQIDLVDTNNDLEEEIVVADPMLKVTKTVNVFDPDNIGLYALPGNDVIYTILVSNTGNTEITDGSILMIDTLPKELIFYNDDADASGPSVGNIYIIDSGSGLTFDVSSFGFSSTLTRPNNFSECDYTPVGTYDSLVRHVCVVPSGTMNSGSNVSEFSINFRMNIP